MAVLNTDLFLLSRAGVHYNETVANLLSLSAGSTNLGAGTVNTTSYEITSSNGTNHAIASATNLLAGVMPSADKAKVDFLTVTGAVNLDTIDTNSAANTADIADLRSTTGTADGDTNMGTMTSTVYTDGNNLKQMLESVGAAVEAIPNRVQTVVADIVARDALTGSTAGDLVFVTDASADGTVTAGAAMYIWNGAAWIKVSEGESLDVITNLGAGTVNATTYEVTSSTGANHAIASATGALAGVMPAADKAKVDFLTVTGAVNLDTLGTNSHVAATTSGTATTNPVTITGQAIGFDISALATAP